MPPSSTCLPAPTAQVATSTRPCAYARTRPLLLPPALRTESALCTPPPAPVDASNQATCHQPCAAPLPSPYYAYVELPLPLNARVRKQKGSFITDKSLVLRELHCAAEQQSCAGQQEILERESLPRVETCTHAIVTNIVRYATEDDKVVPLMDNKMKYSSSSPTKRHIEDTAACSNSAQPKKLKYYFLKDEKLKC
ncbi:hypothetical protein PR202_gb16009 [Eleusine coracana subsp. coracana]|uniref:Uncharacterized protein n=1 Tax=Eleusine coracana subsp. coracana TaxID=191504 RepID=A0AAV5EZD3_ELECO|nr:hypothetical protein PR202_gb16009 [Eleusine coracana subsp. coracana]